MDNNATRLSVKSLLLTGACLLGVLSSAVKGDECLSTAPHGVFFSSAGSRSGALVLSLAIPEPHAIEGSRTIVVTRLQTNDSANWILFSDLPLGDYSLEVYDLSSGREVLNRPGYIDGISQIAIQRLSKPCPVYESVDVNERYDLKPGSYSIRASRQPTRLISWQPYRVERLPTVVSNEIRFQVKSARKSH